MNFFNKEGHNSAFIDSVDKIIQNNKILEEERRIKNNFEKFESDLRKVFRTTKKSC